MTTPNTDLTEQIAEAMHAAEPIQITYAHGVEELTWGDLDEDERDYFLSAAAAVLPIVEAAVKAGKAEALRGAADQVQTNAAGDHCRPCHRTDADLIRLLVDELENGDTR